MSAKSVSVKLLSVTMGAGLALTGVSAIQSAPAARAAEPGSAIVAGVSGGSLCDLTVQGYRNARAANAAAQRSAKRVVKKARAARYKSQANGTKYTASVAHRKLINAVSRQLKKTRSKTKGVKVSTRCHSRADMARINKASAKINRAVKPLTKANARLGRSVTGWAKTDFQRYLDNTSIDRTVTLKTRTQAITGVVIPKGMHVVLWSVDDRTASYKSGVYLSSGIPNQLTSITGRLKPGETVTAGRLNSAIKWCLSMGATEVLI